MNSKQKGNQGEREFAKLCNEYGFEKVKRAVQYGYGGIDNPDCAGLEGIHIEVKRVERLNVSEAMHQSIADANEQAMPIVAHRKNREEWLITMRANDWFELYKEWHKCR